MTPEQIEQMRRDMEAGTPGPWRVESPDQPYASPAPQEREICLACVEHTDFDALEIFAPDPYDMGKNTAENHQANARRIARLPALEAAYLALRDEAGALKAENERLREEIQMRGRLIDAVARAVTPWGCSAINGDTP